MQKYKIGNVNFLNSFPFRYGLETKNIDFETFVPSVIADKLERNELDIGLVPVATYLNHPEWRIIGNYGIIAEKKVRTVLLASKVPVFEIKSVKFDKDSRSSNQLCKVLMDKFWKCNPIWNPQSEADACIQIGDKAFNAHLEYPYIYDLAEEWNKFTGFPFVFAVWVSNKQIDSNFALMFNDALEFGINHIEETIEKYRELLKIEVNDARNYLTHNITYTADFISQMAIMLFNDYSNVLNLKA